jgi:hypothetical protein
MMDLQASPGPHVGLCWRIVETQEIAATRSITRSAADQHRLEALLDASKPAIPPDCQGLSYLLFTPFRYPPLNYGSRFGSTLERGIFYGSAELTTAFAETAVYLWLFQSGPLITGPLERIRDQRTAFSVRVASQKALDLTEEAFHEIQDKLRNPASWQFTQELGTQLRALGTEFFWYPSARWQAGRNIAVFSPKTFVTKQPEQQLHWNLQLTPSTCWFGRQDADSIEFQRSEFEVKGAIPHPCL